jgi:anaphase-promoting complex subunit 6
MLQFAIYAEWLCSIWANANNQSWLFWMLLKSISSATKFYPLIQALDMLMNNHMLTIQEQEDLLAQFNSQGIPKNQSELIISLYKIRMSKYAPFAELSVLQVKLDKLKNNASVKMAEAEILMTRYNFHKALKILSDLYQKEPHNLDCVCLYIVCLSQLSLKNELFVLAHKLSEIYPQKAIPWFAIGAYYITVGKYLEARSFFKFL